MNFVQGTGATDPSKVQFQKDLDNWFQSRGVLSDLRSHLRHLMITALQNTDLGPESREETSPKGHALDLLVTEYLTWRGCHYTLSVYASEVPAVAGFRGTRDRRTTKKIRGHVGDRPRANGNGFQESQLEEIFNALGFSSGSEEVKHLKCLYLDESNEKSLLELILQSAVDVSAKLSIQQTVESQIQHGVPAVSLNWASQVARILLAEKLQPSQVTSIQRSIISVTQREMRKSAEEERARQMNVLRTREKRIQDHLRKFEEDILVKLTEADRDLTSRKYSMDEELNEKQTSLLKMAREWSVKHEEIVQMSKNFYNISDENRSLKKSVEELEIANKHLTSRNDAQKAKINELQEEVTAMMSNWKTAKESNALLRRQIQVLINKRNEKVTVKKKDRVTQESDKNAVSSDAGKCDDFDKDGEFQPDHGSETEMVEQTTGNVMEADVRADSVDEDDIDGGDSCSDEMDDACKTLRYLEEESQRIAKSYLAYKMKYSSAAFVDLDSSIQSSNESVKTEERSARDNASSYLGPDLTLKLEKFSQTEREIHLGSKSVEKTRWTDAVPKCDDLFPSTQTVSRDFGQKIVMKNPTKRQMKNRECYLKNRQLLMDYERTHGGREGCRTDSNSSPDSCTLTSPEVNSNGSRASKRAEQSVDTPLKTTAFYCKTNTPEAEKEVHQQQQQQQQQEQSEVPDKSPGRSTPNCLILLRDAKINPPNPNKLLRQQILLTSLSDECPDQSIGDDETKVNTHLDTTAGDSLLHSVSG